MTRRDAREIPASLERLSAKLCRMLIVVPCLAIAVIVALLAFSSIRRYLIGMPVASTEELAALLFLSMAFLRIRRLRLFERLPGKLIQSNVPAPFSR